MKKNPAILLAATHSGGGKTTITIGLLAALQKKGVKIQPFKCGPDFIDPTLHRLVTGKESRNLDLKMCGAEFVNTCFNTNAKDADISVIEGVMGLFDGGLGSAASLAKELQIPVILVMDTRSCAESIAAVAKGFETLDPELDLAGIILNRVGSPRHLKLLQDALEKHCQTPVLGAVPRDEDFSIPDRHLGLLMGNEAPLSKEQIGYLAKVVDSNIDINYLLSIANKKSSCAFKNRPSPAPTNFSNAEPTVKIAVARDQAFCFYYQDNLDILEKEGADLIEFSPLQDNALPENIQGIYLGGGYPELFAEQLSNNQSMRNSIKKWSLQGKPLYAECGGFMYLTKSIINNAQTWPMTGVFPVNSQMQNRLSSLGYRQIKVSTPSVLGQEGFLYGHEFHYSAIEEMPPEITRVFTLQDGRQEGYTINNTLGSYVHLHFGKTPQAAANFVNLCRQELMT